ncbi:MAG: hypothetical protein AB3N20_02675 [Rhizobiaceae bacterium]
MFGVTKQDLPDSALLGVYERSDGSYTDCYSTDAPGEIDLGKFVAAFYTTWLFKLERFILKHAVSRPSTDQDARDVSEGKTDRFAAWTVESRTSNQLLMCDMAGRTRSWFMVRSNEVGTRLYFGSAVVPKKGGDANLGVVFSALLGFHKLYSRALLAAAVRRLSGQRVSSIQSG